MGDDTGIDWFNTLPDDVILRIIMLLDCETRISLAATATKLWQLWMSAPVFKISNHGVGLECITQYANSIEKMIALRSKEQAVYKMLISWTWIDIKDKLLVNTWIKNAARCQVGELALEFSTDGNDIDLPNSLFGCQSLKKLEISASFTVECPRLIFPTGNNKVLESLEYLKLSNVGFYCQNLETFVLSSCPNLKWLTLSNVYGFVNLVIRSSSLVKLSMDSDSHTGYSTVDVSAPKLQSLYLNTPCRGQLALHLSTPQLRKLHLDLHSLSIFRVRETMQFLNTTSFVVKVQYSQSVLQHLVKTLCPVEHLTVSKPLIRALADGSIMFNDLKLREVTDLVITVKHNFETYYRNSQAHAMASFLEKLPNLEYLRLEGCPASSQQEASNGSCSTKNTDSWKSMNLEFIRKLKTVELDFSGTKDEAELVYYLLEKASALESCIIKKRPSDARSMLEGTALCVEDLAKFKKLKII